MVKEHLHVYARVKPSSDSNEQQDQKNTRWYVSDSVIRAEVYKTKLSNAKDQHDFGFSHVFGEDSSQ